MKQEQYAVVKTIFLNAIDLPVEQQQAFIEHASEGDARIREEVQSLLEHHTRETLLPLPIPSAGDTVSAQNAKSSGLTSAKSPGSRLRGAPVEEPGAHARRAHITKDTASFASSSLVLSEMWDENRALLQSRLRVFAVILGTVMTYTLLLNLIPYKPSWALIIRLIAWFVNLVCLVWLSRKQRPSLERMRMLEVVVGVNTAVVMLAVDLLQMQQLAAVGDAFQIGRGHMWNYVVWSVFILLYGMFIPNTWQRAAAILFVVAFFPYAIDLFNRTMHPLVAELLGQYRFALPFPLPLVAAGAGVLAANTLHGSRLTAFRARRLAQYELLNEIGSGGMGKVYEARHVMLKRPCAIKLIHAELSADERQIAIFSEEVRATCQLTHPNTIRVYDFGESHSGQFFYVMELLPGSNLFELVNVSGPLPPARAIHLLVQICGALGEAHSVGMVHRDVKPGNIYITTRGGILDFAKLLDFGLVRRITDAETSNLPKVVTAGTPEYMSPEQVVDYANIDCRSDIYSLGAVAYFLLTGQPPFRRKNYMELFEAHARAVPEPPISIRPEIGFELNQIVLKCLAKSPGDRYASAAELSRKLEQCAITNPWSQSQAAASWEGGSRSRQTLDALSAAKSTL